VKPFPCTQCGLCCQHVDLSEQTRFLDRGDGTCTHYDATRKACSIYARRPDICRVDRQYLQNYAQHFTWDEFVALNLQVCTALEQGAFELQVKME
jgi:Fe-S-cluster containining protein